MRDGNRARYESMVHEHGARLFRFAFRMTGDQHLAEDLTQEAFGHALRSAETLKDIENSYGWLLAILRNLINQWLRQQYRRPRSTSLDHIEDELQAPDETSAAEQHEWIQRAVSRLDVDLRETVLLVMMEGWSTEEAARLQGIPRGTVLSRLHRGRQKLRAIFQRFEQNSLCDGSQR